MSDARRCGVWVRGSGCVSLFGHKGPHRSSYSAEIATLQSQKAARDAALARADEMARLTKWNIVVTDCGEGCEHPACLILRSIAKYQDARAALAAPTSGEEG